MTDAINSYFSWLWPNIGVKLALLNIRLSVVHDKVAAMHLLLCRDEFEDRPTLGANFTLFERSYEQDIACQKFRETFNT